MVEPRVHLMAPAYMIASFTHVGMDALHPLHAYPYIVLIIAPEVPVVITNMLFLCACIWLIERDVGMRACVTLFLSVLCTHLGLGSVYATYIASGYFGVVHVPMHYFRCAKRREIISMIIAFSWFGAVLILVRIMPESPKGFNLSCGWQHIIVCHTLSLRSLDRARARARVRAAARGQ
jgi:hypothetical protein